MQPSMLALLSTPAELTLGFYMRCSVVWESGRGILAASEGVEAEPSSNPLSVPMAGHRTPEPVYAVWRG